MKWELLQSGTVPGVSTLCLPDVTTHDQISQAFPLCICILQAIKHWMGMAWEQGHNNAETITAGKCFPRVLNHAEFEHSWKVVISQATL